MQLLLRYLHTAKDSFFPKLLFRLFRCHKADIFGIFAMKPIKEVLTISLVPLNCDRTLSKVSNISPIILLQVKEILVSGQGKSGLTEPSIAKLPVSSPCRSQKRGTRPGMRNHCPVTVQT